MRNIFDEKYAFETFAVAVVRPPRIATKSIAVTTSITPIERNLEPSDWRRIGANQRRTASLYSHNPMQNVAVIYTIALMMCINDRLAIISLGV